MKHFHEAVVYLNDPANWRGANGFAQLTIVQVELTVYALLIAAVIALPIGLWLGHVGRGGTATVLVANVTRALPTLALLTILATFPSLGLGTVPTIIALAVFAIPPLLVNTYVGMREVDSDIKEAAAGMGLSSAQILRRVELPLAIPLIAAGFRTAAVQVVATATLAAYVGGGGLGTNIVIALTGPDYGLLISTAFLVAVLSLAVEGLGALAQRLATPAGLRGAARISTTRQARRAALKPA